MRRNLTLVSFLVIALIAMMAQISWASLSNPFGGMKEIKMLDGKATVAVCSTQNPESRLFWADKGDEVPRGAWLNVSWDYLSPDASYPDREAWMGFSDPTSVYDRRKSTFEGGKVIRQKHAYRMTIWQYVPEHPTENTLSFAFGVKGRRGEKDKTEKIILQVSTHTVAEFVSQNSVVAPSFSAPPIQLPAPSEPKRGPEPERAKVHEETGSFIEEPMQQITLVLGGERNPVYLADVNMDDIHSGQKICFRRNGAVAAEADVTKMYTNSQKTWVTRTVGGIKRRYCISAGASVVEANLVWGQPRVGDTPDFGGGAR